MMHYGLRTETGREQHSKIGALSAQSSHELIAVDARHDDVCDHQIGLEPLETPRERLFTAACGDDVIAAPFEHATGDGTHTGFIIDEQH